MFFGAHRFKDWKQGHTLPSDSPFIPDHAIGYGMEISIDVWGPHERVSAHGADWIWRRFDGKTFYPELIEHYHAAIELCGDKIESKVRNQLQQKLIALDTNTEMSLAEKYQWLGYIRWVLCEAGVFSVDEDLEFTEDILPRDE